MRAASQATFVAVTAGWMWQTPAVSRSGCRWERWAGRAWGGGEGRGPAWFCPLGCGRVVEPVAGDVGVHPVQVDADHLG